MADTVAAVAVAAPVVAADVVVRTVGLTQKDIDSISTALSQQVNYLMRKPEQFGPEAGAYFLLAAEGCKTLITKIGGTLKVRQARERK